MRKFLLLAATAALTLASCTEEVILTQDDVLSQVEANSESNAITFGTYLGKTGTTRAGTAGTITTTSLKTGTHKTDGFGVMAYQMTAVWADDQTSTKPNFMYNQQVKWNSPNWTYSPVKYWPNGIDKANASDPSKTAYSDNADKLNFFAYAPWVEAATYTDAKSTITIPSGSHDAFWATGCSASSLNNGITAFTYSGLQAAPEVMYYIPTATSAEAVDLLWGLRGSKQYIETDNENNPSSPFSSLGSQYNVNLTKQIVPETVDFLFKHALSKVGGNTKSSTSVSGAQQCGLQVVVDIDANGSGTTGTDNQNSFLGSSFDNTKTLVTIKSVNIRDGKSIAGSENVAAGTKSNLKNSGWFNLATGAWNNVGIITSTGGTSTEGATYSIEATTSGTYKLDPKIAEPTSGITGILDKSGDPYVWNGDGTTGPSGVTKTAQNVYSDATDVPGLLLIPNGAEAQTIYVTTEYIVRTADKHLASGYSEVTQKVTNSVDLTGLDVNKYYTLVMHLGLTSVKFSAIVTDWASTDDATYDEDGTHQGSNVTNKEVWLPSNVIISETTSTTIAAGNNATVYTAGGTTSYTINLTGVKASTALASVAYTGVATAAAQSGSTDSSGNAVVTVTLPENTSTTQTKTSTITINGTNASDAAFTSIVTIIQSKKP